MLLGREEVLVVLARLLEDRALGVGVGRLPLLLVVLGALGGLAPALDLVELADGGRGLARLVGLVELRLADVVAERGPGGVLGARLEGLVKGLLAIEDVLDERGPVAACRLAGVAAGVKDAFKGACDLGALGAQEELGLVLVALLLLERLLVVKGLVEDVELESLKLLEELLVIRRDGRLRLAIGVGHGREGGVDRLVDDGLQLVGVEQLAVELVHRQRLGHGQRLDLEGDGPVVGRPEEHCMRVRRGLHHGIELEDGRGRAGV